MVRSRCSTQKRANGGGKPHRKIDYVIECTMRKRILDFSGCDSGVVVVLSMDKVWGWLRCLVAAAELGLLCTNLRDFVFFGRVFE